MIHVIIFVTLTIGLGSDVFEIPLRRSPDGSYVVGSRLSNCANDGFVNMTLDLSHSSWIHDGLVPCTISLPTVSGTRDMMFDDPDATHFLSSVTSPSAIAIGPRSHTLRLHEGIEVIKSTPNMSVRFGGHFDTFTDAFCFPGSVLEIPVLATDSQSVYLARFDLTDPLSGDSLNTTVNEPVFVAIEEFAGRKAFATLPTSSLGSRLDSLLTSHGAHRQLAEARTRLPLSRQGVWAYSNCTNETIAYLPNLSIELFNERGELSGSIILTPSEYMPDCEFRVNDGSIEHVVTDQTFLSLDVFQIPKTNIRIENNKIFICDSLQ